MVRDGQLEGADIMMITTPASSHRLPSRRQFLTASTATTLCSLSACAGTTTDWIRFDPAQAVATGDEDSAPGFYGRRVDQEKDCRYDVDPERGG